jgi:hypothetical protein
LILALLAVGTVGHLAMQTKIQEQGFELAALQDQREHLNAEAVVLRATLDKQSTPAQLAQAAAGLGMVADPYSTFVALPIGAVSGVNKPVAGNEVPAISRVPTPPTPIAPPPTDTAVQQ